MLVSTRTFLQALLVCCIFKVLVVSGGCGEADGEHCLLTMGEDKVEKLTPPEWFKSAEDDGNQDPDETDEEFIAKGAARTTVVENDDPVYTYTDIWWSPEKETLREFLGGSDTLSPSTISKLGILSHRDDLSVLSSACKSLGLNELLPNLKVVHFHHWRVNLNILKCLFLFAPQIDTLILDGTSVKDNLGKKDLLGFETRDALIFDNIKRLLIDICFYGTQYPTYTLTKVYTMFPSLQSLGLTCATENDIGSMTGSEIYPAFKASEPPSSIKHISLLWKIMESGKEDDYIGFCDGHQVKSLNLQNAASSEAVEHLVAACSRTLDELHVKMADYGNWKDSFPVTPVQLSPMPKLKRLGLNLYHDRSEYFRRAGFWCFTGEDFNFGSVIYEIGGQDTEPFPLLEHLILEINHEESSHLRPKVDVSGIFENEDFFLQLRNVKELTIFPVGLRKSEPQYLAVMKKFATWFPKLRTRSLDLIRYGVMDLTMMTDEFLPNRSSPAGFRFFEDLK